jgi:hypothetical protein
MVPCGSGGIDRVSWKFIAAGDGRDAPGLDTVPRREFPAESASSFLGGIVFGGTAAPDLLEIEIHRSEE